MAFTIDKKIKSLKLLLKLLRFKRERVNDEIKKKK